MSPFAPSDPALCNLRTVAKTVSGFAEQRKIKVLSEELFYNAQSQGFRVLLIDRPFVGGTEVWHSLPMMRSHPVRWQYSGILSTAWCR